MSRYFDALNRLRRGRDAASRSDLRLATQAEPAFDSESTDRPGLPFPDLQLASRQTSYAALLDLLRAATKSGSSPVLVIAGVSGKEPVHEVVAGVELQAQKRGISLRRGSLGLEGGTRLLRLSSAHPLRESTSPTAWKGGEALDLSGAQGSGSLAAWLESSAEGGDLLLIHAPPLSSSLDAALLGAACGGLVLVAETLVTERSSLRAAIEKAQLPGCTIVGLVLAGARQWLPRWLARLLALLRRS